MKEVINVSNILDLSYSLTMDKNTKTTKDLVAEFNKTMYDFILAKDILLTKEQLFFDATVGLSIRATFIIAKKQTKTSIIHTICLSEVLNLIKYSEKNKIQEEYRDIFNDIIENIYDYLDKIYILNDEGMVESKFKNEELAFDLDFSIKVNAQENGDIYGNTSNEFYIEKVIIEF